MADNQPYKTSDLIQDDGGITLVINQLIEVNRLYEQTRKNIVDSVREVGKETEKLNSTQKDHFQTIKKNAEMVEEFKQQQDKLDDSIRENAATLAILKEREKELMKQKIDAQKLNSEQLGFYEQQNLLLKTLTQEYKKLSEAELKSAKGEELLKKLNDTRTSLDEMDKSMRNFQRNVGNYADATKNLKTELRELISEMAKMKSEGKDNTEQYAKMRKRAGELQDTIGDARAEVALYASDTRKLDMAIGIFEGIGAAAQVAEGASALLGDENEDLTKSIQKMVAIQSVLNGIQEIQNALQQESAAMMGLNALKTKAAAAWQAIYTTTVGTSTGALKVFRIALLGTGIGAILVGLGLLIMNWDKLTSSVKAGSKALDGSRIASDDLRESHNEHIEKLRDLEIELKVVTGALSEFEAELMRLNNTYDKEILDVENETEKQVAKATGFGSMLINYLKGAGNAMLANAALSKELIEIAAQDAEKRTKIEERRGKEIEVINAKHQKELEKQAADAEKKRLDELKKAAEAREKAIQDDFSRRITNIQNQLESEGNETMEYFQLQESLLLVRQQKELHDAEKLGLDKVAIKRKYDTQLLQLQDNFNNLAMQRSLELWESEKQMYADQETFRLSQENEYKAQDERIRNAKITNLQNRLAVEETYSAKSIELQKQLLTVQMEAEIAQAREMGANTEYIKDKYKKLIDEVGKDDNRSILGKILGLDEKKDQAVMQTVDTVTSSIKNYLGTIAQAADEAVAKSEKAVQASLDALNREVENRNAGYANNVDIAQKEYENAKKQNEKAVKEREKIARTQAKLDTIEQASSMITATANIWKTFTQLGPFGYALAIIATASMWGLFAASKIKAAQLRKQEYGQGGYEFLDGGSHYSGNDIPIGQTKDGRQRTAEGGETLAIFNKKATRRYKSAIPDIINSINKGTFDKLYSKGKNATDAMIVNIGLHEGLNKIGNDVSAIRKANEKKMFIDSQGNVIEKYKNVTIKHLKNG